VVALSSLGVRREWDSEYACAKDLGVTVGSIQQAKLRSGSCKGWRIFDSPEIIRERIAEMESQLKMLAR